MSKHFKKRGLVIGHKLIKQSVALVLAFTLSSTVFLTSAWAQSGYRYYNGQSAFRGAVRDYGRKIGRGAMNHYDRARKKIKRYDKIRKFGSTVNNTRKLLKRRGPLPIMIIPKNSPGYYRGNGEFY